jgi:NAD(P)-dependent dehydrogenase (short-subunit alcohol dehydrogenase family)
MNLQEVTQWYNFSGKTIVITGGTGVLGGEMACALVGCGANVAVLDRNPTYADGPLWRSGRLVGRSPVAAVARFSLRYRRGVAD